MLLLLSLWLRLNDLFFVLLGPTLFELFIARLCSLFIVVYAHYCCQVSKCSFLLRFRCYYYIGIKLSYCMLELRSMSRDPLGFEWFTSVVGIWILERYLLWIDFVFCVRLCLI